MGSWVKLLLFAALLWSNSADADEEIYSFGVVPQYEARALSEAWTPILAELSKRVGKKFELVGSPRIPEFEESFLRGDFDFAYMNPYHALMAFKKQKYQPIVKDVSRPLSGIIVVKKSSPIKSVEELANQKISFPAPNAVGASLLIRSDLTEKFKVKFDSVYAQTHTSAYLNVVLGVTAAAGGVKSTLNQQKADVSKNLRVIYTTTEIAPHPIVAHPRVDRKLVEVVRKTLIEMSKEEALRETFSKVPIGEAGKAEVSDYAPIEKLHLDKYYVRF